MVFFFYGTLMDPETLRQVIGVAPVEEIGVGTVSGTMYDMGDYPGVVLGGAERVHGLLLDVDGDAVSRLDEYEGVGAGLYARRIVSVEIGEGTPIAASTYEYLGSVAGLQPISRWQPRAPSSERG